MSPHHLSSSRYTATSEIHLDGLGLELLTECSFHCRVAAKMSIKFTNEPPAGIKAGLKRTYQNITQDLLDISNMPAWKPMLYCVSYLHTVVQVFHLSLPLASLGSVAMSLQVTLSIHPLIGCLYFP